MEKLRDIKNREGHFSFHLGIPEGEKREKRGENT